VLLNMPGHLLLIKLISHSFFHGYNSFRAFPKTRPQTVAVLVAHQLGLAVDNLQRALSTCGDANPTSLHFSSSILTTFLNTLVLPPIVDLLM